MPVYMRRPLVLIGLLGVAVTVNAAPMSSQEAPAPSAPPLTTLQPSAGAGSDGAINAQTMDLLLQLQDKPNALGSAPAPRAEGSVGVRSGAAPVAADSSEPLVSKETLLELKALVLPGGSGGDVERSERSGSRQRLADDDLASARSAPSARKSSDEPWAAPRSTLFDSPVVRFIRENRYAVLGGSIALLAALWLTANVRVKHSSRRRR